MPLRALEDLLRQTMGLDPAAIGSKTIESAVHKRMSACAQADMRRYLERVRSVRSELQALIEAVVIAETWFFRDRAAFAELANAILAGRLRPARDVLRLLSLPCSSGEEPYTMAMTLLDAGLTSDRFSIEAVDISASLVARGKRGLYGAHSFRGGDLRFRDRHFEATPDGYVIYDDVHACVSFRAANMLEPGAFPGTRVYDAIFCRNLLVYFDRPAQERAISILRRVLAPDGMLFVGSSEAGLMFARGFMSSKAPYSFAYKAQRAPLDGTDGTAPGQKIPECRARGAKPPDAANVGASADVPHGEGVVRGAYANTPREGSPAREEDVSTYALSSRALHLDGLASLAAGETRAATEKFRKALFLEPTNTAALVSLASLLERDGDVRAARLLSDRVERLRLASRRAR